MRTRCCGGGLVIKNALELVIRLETDTDKWDGVRV